MNRRTPLRSTSLVNSSVGNLLRHPLLVVAWILFCLITGVQLIRSGLRTRGVLEKKQDAQDALNKEEQKALKLIQELERTSGKEYQERIIREELRMQKPGEVILQIPTPIPDGEGK